MPDPRWSHLHSTEQARLEQGRFNREELAALAKGENPWPNPLQEPATEPQGQSDNKINPAEDTSSIVQSGPASSEIRETGYLQKIRDWLKEVFNKLPGPRWLKWAEVIGAASGGLVGFKEYLVAEMFLFACLGCGIAQIYVWTVPVKSRLLREVSRVLLAVVTISVFAIVALTINKIRGKEQWSNWSEQDARSEMASRTPSPFQNASPAPSSISGIREHGREVVIDKRGVALHVGRTTIYPQMQVEYDYQTDIYLFVVYVEETELTLDVCIRLLDYYPELKAEMLKGVSSSEFYPDLRVAVNSGFVLNYKSSLTKNQIELIKEHAKRLGVNVRLEGPAPP